MKYSVLQSGTVLQRIRLYKYKFYVQNFSNIEPSRLSLLKNNKKEFGIFWKRKLPALCEVNT